MCIRDRPGSDSGADPHRGGTAPVGEAGGGPPSRPRHRMPHQRGGSGGGFPPRCGHRVLPASARRLRGAGGFRPVYGLYVESFLRFHDRQSDCPRAHPPCLLYTSYEALYRDLQPGLNVYWCGFGQPPTLSFRAAFDDLSYNRERQRRRELLKGRFQGGNLGWVDRRDWELYAGLYRKPLERFSDRQRAVLELLEREGPLNIQLIKDCLLYTSQHLRLRAAAADCPFPSRYLRHYHSGEDQQYRRHCREDLPYRPHPFSRDERRRHQRH